MFMSALADEFYGARVEYDPLNYVTANGVQHGESGYGLLYRRMGTQTARAWQQSSDLPAAEARLWALNNEMPRAVRLAVDTGMHAQGWSREKAIAYTVDNLGYLWLPQGIRLSGTWPHPPRRWPTRLAL